MAFIEDLGSTPLRGRGRGPGLGFTVSSSSSHVQPQGGGNRPVRMAHHQTEPTTVRRPAGPNPSSSRPAAADPERAPAASGSRQPGLFGAWSTGEADAQRTRSARTLRQALPPEPTPRALPPAPRDRAVLTNALTGLTLLTPWLQGVLPVRAEELPAPYVPTPHPAMRWRRGHTEPAAAWAAAPPQAAFGAPAPAGVPRPARPIAGTTGAPSSPGWGGWLRGLQAALGRGARAVWAASRKTYFWIVAAALLALGMGSRWALPQAPRRP
jgi:hypothetical protein